MSKSASHESHEPHGGHTVQQYAVSLQTAGRSRTKTVQQLALFFLYIAGGDFHICLASRRQIFLSQVSKNEDKYRKAGSRQEDTSGVGSPSINKL